MIPLAQWESHFIICSGVKLHYLRRGSGQPAVLLHGFSDNGACWGRTAHALAETFDVVALDLRAHGLSDAPETSYNLDALIRDVEDVLTGLELENVLLLGHSLGASVALSLAARSKHIDELVLIDAPLDVKLQGRSFAWLEQLQALSVEERLESRGAELRGWSPEEKQHWAEAKGQLRFSAWEKHALDFSLQWRDDLAKLTCQTLLVRGEPNLGSLVTDSVAAELSSQLGEKGVVLLPNTGHSPHRENFAGFADILKLIAA